MHRVLAQEMIQLLVKSAPVNQLFQIFTRCRHHAPAPGFPAGLALCGCSSPLEKLEHAGLIRLAEMINVREKEGVSLQRLPVPGLVRARAVLPAHLEQKRIQPA